MPAASVLSARDLQVSFPSGQTRVPALDGIDMDIEAGSLFVLLGPNGAGKTTLLRCITGLVQPGRGTLTVFGNQISGSASRHLARLGVLIENPGLYGRLNAREYLEFFGSFYGIPNLEERITNLCGELGLPLDKKPVAKLSQGNRQKLQLARSLLHRPQFLLWDEPTDHLDPVSQRQVLEYLRKYLDTTGASALVATHRLEQMESVASHFGFLAGGKLKATGSRDEILGQGDGQGQARLGFARTLVKGELDGLAEEFAVEINIETHKENDIHLDRDVLILGSDLTHKIPGIIKALVNRNLPLARVEPLRASLAEAYERWVGK